MAAYKVLFVCYGNICRSPTAEYVFKHLAEKAGLAGSLHAESAGTSNWEVGCDRDERSCKAALKRGVRLGGKARQLRKADFDNFDKIIAMDNFNYSSILKVAPTKAHQDKVVRFCQYTKLAPEVPDPYSGDTDGFEHVLDIIWDGCQNLIKEIDEQQKASQENGSQQNAS